MKQARRTAFLLVLLPFMSVRLALGQGDDGFLRGQGNLDVAPSYSVDTYNAFWVGRESVESPDVGRVTRTTYNLYTAYGLTYAVGDGQTDYRLQGVVQYRLETFFAALETGYDVRTGLPHDEIPLHLTAGFNFDPYLISAFFSTVDSLGG